MAQQEALNSLNTKTPIAVIGAGLAGSMMALILARRGFHVEVYEKRADFRATTMEDDATPMPASER